MLLEKDLCITPFHHEMRAAPAGEQAGAARCCHREYCFGLAVGLSRGLRNVVVNLGPASRAE